MTKPISILVAEDEENDVFLLRRALQKAGVTNPLIVARDGQEAIDLLKATVGSRGTGRPPPGLVLLDLMMPRLNGFEVLAWLQTRSDLKHLPVAVLSSSAQDEDIQRTKEMGAVDYRVKPCQIEDLVQILKELDARWLRGTADRT